MMATDDARLPLRTSDDLIHQVNPGLKSRVADVIDFPDFTAAAAAELAALQLATKKLSLPTGALPSALEQWMAPLVDAPSWANGRDIETFVKRVTVECATRGTTTVTTEALDAALSTLLKMKGSAGGAPSRALSARLPSRASPSPPLFQTSEPVFFTPPAFDLQKAIREAKMEVRRAEGQLRRLMATDDD